MLAPTCGPLMGQKCSRTDYRRGQVSSVTGQLGVAFQKLLAGECQNSVFEAGEGLRGEESISELCRREGIAASMYYGWSKEFLEAGNAGWPAIRCAPRRPAR